MNYNLTLFSLIFIPLHLYSAQPISKKIIKKYLPENPIILEAGAYDGKDTKEMAKLWQKSTIYAFEPVPHLYDKIHKLTLNYPQIHSFKLALSNVNGNANFYVSTKGSDASSSLLKPKEHLKVCPEVKFGETILVTTITLDDWAQKNNIDHIDFMWLDMQGSEYQMLKASTKILPTVQVILTEVSLRELYEGCPLYPQYKSWLESEGFKVVIEDFSHRYWGDALFVRKDLLNLNEYKVHLACFSPAQSILT